jgi:DUF4097 and DUF4098 domain-containing protein YvlB
MQHVVRISTRSGRVVVIAEDRSDIIVEKGGRSVVPDVDEDGRTLTITSRSSEVRARVPTGTDVVVGTLSSRIDLRGEFGAAAITNTSGRIDVDRCSSLEARLVSGRLTLGTCSGSTRIDAKSGRVSIESTGDLRVGALSGRVTVGEATGSVRIRSVSGRVEATLTATVPDVKIESVSGRITLVVPPTVTPVQRFATRSGSIKCEVPDGGDPALGTILARTMSGSIRVRTQ